MFDRVSISQTRPEWHFSCVYLKSSDWVGNMGEIVLFQDSPPIRQVHSTSYVLLLCPKISLDQLPQILLQGEKASQVFCAAGNILLQ